MSTEQEFSVNDIVTVPLKNRWGIDCAAVWNLDGPGGDRLVKGIPKTEYTKQKH